MGCGVLGTGDTLSSGGLGVMMRGTDDVGEWSSTIEMGDEVVWGREGFSSKFAGEEEAWG